MHPYSRRRPSRRALVHLALAGAMLAASACTDFTAPPAEPPAPRQPDAVEFVVTDDQTGQPIELAQVLLDPGNGARLGVTSDARGVARFASLPAGKYTVQVRRIGYMPTASTLRMGAAGPRQERLRLRLSRAAMCTLGSIRIVDPRRSR